MIMFSFCRQTTMACSGEEIPESSTLGIDKRLLAKAVELGNDKQLLSYSYGKQLLPKDVMLHAIKVADLGDIPIPVSIEVKMWYFVQLIL